jgi:hypothetical protein
MPVNLTELIDAFTFVNFSEGENQAYVDRRTGRIHYHSDISDMDEDPLEDIDSEHYLAAPDRRDLGLGHRLALRFAEEHLPDDYRDVEAFFHRRGAYARFKDLLARRGALDHWCAYSEAAEQAARRYRSGANR